MHVAKLDNKLNSDFEDKSKASEEVDRNHMKIQLAAGETNDKEVQKVNYELSAVICYINDKNNEDRRNLVALIRVGDNYHERSICLRF